MAHTGKFVDVEGNSVQARWAEQGAWQKMTIASKMGGVLHSGASVFLIAHTGKMLDTGSEAVQARFTDMGDWQQFSILNGHDGEIREGDTVWLRAYTGKFVDVEGTSVRARWYEQGAWQSFIIMKHHSRLLQQVPGETAQPEDGEYVILGLMCGVGAGLIGAVFLLALATTACSKRMCCKWPLFNSVSIDKV